MTVWCSCCNPGINDQLRGCCNQPPLGAAPCWLQMVAQWHNVVVVRAAAWAATRIHLGCSENTEPYWCRAAWLCSLLLLYDFKLETSKRRSRLVSFVSARIHSDANFNQKNRLFKQLTEYALHVCARITAGNSLFLQILKSPFVKSEKSCFSGTAEKFLFSKSSSLATSPHTDE